MKFLPLIFSQILCLICLTNYKTISKKFSLYDKSNNRKIHKGKISNIGGISIFLSIILVIIINQLVNNDLSIIYIAVTVCLLTMFTLLGIIDDKINLNPTSKTLYLAIVFICVAPIYQNFMLTSLEFLSVPNKQIALSKSSIFFTFLCFFIFFNTVNFLDGANGLLSSITLFWISIIIINKSNIDLIEITFLASLLIFMFFNLKNKVFLGNSGSNLIAIFLTLITIKNYNEYDFLKSDEIFFLFLFPGLDTVRVTIQRILRGQNPLKPDKDHLHHLMMKFINKDFVWIPYLLLTILVFFLFKISLNIFLSFTFSLILYFSIFLFLKKNKS
jgi:UDP-GlcNAc:undecaprenyl-phosphate GlcNAc-1-phosphate transferase